MNHPFLTRRDELQRAQDGIRLATDLFTLASSMTVDDHAALQGHRIPAMADPSVRDVALKHAGRLGMALDDLDALSGNATKLAKDFGIEWKALLQTGTLPAERFRKGLEMVARELRLVRDELMPMEQDDGSSSYSDYSDSHTESTSSEGEEEESTEEKSPSPKKKKKCFKK